MKMKSPILIYAAVVMLALLCSPFLHSAEKITKDEILKTGKEWEDNYTNYEVDQSFIEVLNAKVGDNLTIDVYLGLWCSDSQNNVPKFIKVADLVRTENFTVNYYTVERKASPDVKYYVEDLKVERVPTFVFYRDGKEIAARGYRITSIQPVDMFPQTNHIETVACFEREG